jgi:hypothetical protein
VTTVLEQEAREALDYARQTYMDMGHDNFSPMLHIKQKDGDDILILMMGVPPGFLYEAVQQVLALHPITPLVVFLINDSFAVHFDTDEATPEQIAYEEEQLRLAAADSGLRIPLAVRFRLGDPYVREMLTVTALSEHGTVLVNQVYRWTPVDGWEWNEPTVMSEGGETDWHWDRLINGLPRPSLADLIDRAKEEME